MPIAYCSSSAFARTGLGDLGALVYITNSFTLGIHLLKFGIAWD